ncbi:MAG: biopolymer transporter ExbD [Phycisphaeraceae bacterium]
MSKAVAGPSAEAAEDPTVHHRTARQRRGLAPAKMQPNLSSMIDIIFQLLIYFVVTASFAIDEGVLTATLPTGAGSASDMEPPPETLDIRLVSAGEIGVSIDLGGTGRLDSFTALASELDGLQFDPGRGRHNGVYAPDDPVVIRPAGDVRWQHVVNAFNAAIKARYTNVNFAQPE